MSFLQGILAKGQEIAVKRLSKTSQQGLVPVLGICIQREEKMLIYEYMPNKSLDYYIFGKKTLRS